MAPGDAVAGARPSSQTLQLTVRKEVEKCHKLEWLWGFEGVQKYNDMCWGWASKRVTWVAAGRLLSLILPLLWGKDIHPGISTG